jgi:energy-coupling factor transporter ATP-binding protein EcfA2
MRATTLSELSKMGIDLPDVDVPIGSLSGGQRQCVAIARAVFFSVRVLILDEPTAALGVKQSGVVLKYITAAKEAGFGVVFITHNPHHAHMVGDHFVLLNRGRQKLDCTYDDITLEHLTPSAEETPPPSRPLSGWIATAGCLSPTTSMPTTGGCFAKVGSRSCSTMTFAPTMAVRHVRRFGAQNSELVMRLCISLYFVLGFPAAPCQRRSNGARLIIRTGQRARYWFLRP